jgi:hypothetical protein
MSMGDGTRKGGLVGFGLMLAAVTMFVLGASASVLAHHSSGHTGGPPASSGAASGTEVTEDNDSDGVPNAPDPAGDTDNRHPSGKDKHEEAGGSGNQGNAASEPDGNGSGPERDMNGVDQPGGPGGADVLDQDGNNGCGNDDDFEDDNEGWCGKPHEQATPPGLVPSTPPTTETTPPTTQTTPPTTTETTPPAAVLGVQVSGGGKAGGAGVLGETVAAAGEGAVGAVAAGGALAFTGFEAWPLALLAVGLAIPGLILLRIGRQRARTA